ncbi:hypothetical protein DCCM_3339 [Desulfocucumis palustris]|uniref:Uncharacterized protein n=1 Tax=Desulfocucumis palustris TaxID=1898651 RepID=A0A2L2XD05_9FIRM|nr:hypothetical protein [Desulfocucumis palustris]GBF34227.1 hypothetical protein DCCM_3339 [Desulfocucumis palustris]
MKNKKTILIVSIFILALIISLFFTVLHVQSQITDLFRLNKELQEEGYYMADFEFKMMGMAYWLDHGHYHTALSRLNQLHRQLKTREGLIKMPKFKNKEDELDFYLNLQNARTGAFMDDSYPYCTYNEPTENILSHIDALAEETGQPLRLKYPLKYLDDINTPEKLKAFLEDVSNVGWIASRFPQTTFLFARSLLSYYNGEGVIGEHNLYNFSPEWKQTLLQWFYDNQDRRTGFWGPRSRTSGQLLKRDLTNTASIIKTFIDRNGSDIHQSFPLRYRKEMFKTALGVMSEPIPSDEDLDEWHEWSLKMGKGIIMLTRYLWKDASEDDKAKAKALIEGFVKVAFEKYYVAGEGAFSYYPASEHATLDGTGGKINEFTDIGFFSAEKQKELWGNPEESIIDLGVCNVSILTENNFALITNHPEVNSLRFYDTIPDFGDLTSGVFAVAYPQKSSVRDIMDFTPKMKHWLNTTSQSIGNWVSKEATAQSMNTLEIEEVLIYEDGISLKTMNEFLQKNKRFVVLGFDVLQIPRYKIIFDKK